MLRSVATLLLLLQLRPFAAAAICLQESLATGETCEMAMAGDPAGSKDTSPSAPSPGPTSDCTLAQLCAMPAGAVLSIQPVWSAVTVEAMTTVVPPYLNRLIAIDPAAPLVPPPNA